MGILLQPLIFSYLSILVFSPSLSLFLSSLSSSSFFFSSFCWCCLSKPTSTLMSQLLLYQLKAQLCIMYVFTHTATHFNDAVLSSKTLIYFRYVTFLNIEETGMVLKNVMLLWLFLNIQILITDNRSLFRI